MPDIVDSVLGPYGFQTKRALTASYRTWDYCVQYHETDYQFVARLLEHEGKRPTAPPIARYEIALPEPIVLEWQQLIDTAVGPRG